MCFLFFSFPYRVRVPPRQGALKIQLKGIFVGARVVRGPDWEWNNQDGGPNKTGRVMEIRGWDNESCRSVANVSWASGSTNVYRLGHKGNVDLRYVQPAVGGYYYKDHMPVLGELTVEIVRVKSASFIEQLSQELAKLLKMFPIFIKST